MLQGQLHLSLYHFELVAHVVVLAGKLHGRHAAVIAGVLGHGVGQLDLTAGTGFGAVSYTHLDVYKRQVHAQLSLASLDVVGHLLQIVKALDVVLGIALSLIHT